MLQQRREAVARLGRRPEPGAVVHVENQRYPGLGSRIRKSMTDVRTPIRERGGDSSHMHCACFLYESEIKRIRIHARDSRVGAIVEYPRGPRRSARIKEVQAKPIVSRPDHVRRIDTMPAQFSLNPLAERVLRQHREPRDRTTEPCQRDAEIRLRSAD